MQAKLHRVRWPLYDSVVLDPAVTGESLLFQQAVGQGGKTVLHTNMPKAGSLPHPKVYKVDGVRAVWSMSRQDLTTVIAEDTAGNAAAARAAKAMLALSYGASFRFTVGDKVYLEEPLMTLAANLKLDGPGSTPDHNGGVISSTYWGSTVGMVANITRKPIVLQSDEAFVGEVSIRRAVAVSGLTAGTQTALLYIVLDGDLAREVS